MTITRKEFETGEPLSSSVDGKIQIIFESHPNEAFTLDEIAKLSGICIKNNKALLIDIMIKLEEKHTIECRKVKTEDSPYRDKCGKYWIIKK